MPINVEHFAHRQPGCVDSVNHDQTRLTFQVVEQGTGAFPSEVNHLESGLVEAQQMSSDQRPEYIVTRHRIAQGGHQDALLFQSLGGDLRGATPRSDVARLNLKKCTEQEMHGS